MPALAELASTNDIIVGNEKFGFFYSLIKYTLSELNVELVEINRILASDQELSGNAHKLLNGRRQTLLKIHYDFNSEKILAFLNEVYNLVKTLEKKGKNNDEVVDELISSNSSLVYKVLLLEDFFVKTSWGQNLFDLLNVRMRLKG